VEGQGSLIHRDIRASRRTPARSCPDALILCHQVTRDYIGDYHGREPWVKIPSYVEMIDIYESAAQPLPTRPCHRVQTDPDDLCGCTAAPRFVDVDHLDVDGIFTLGRDRDNRRCSRASPDGRESTRRGRSRAGVEA